MTGLMNTTCCACRPLGCRRLIGLKRSFQGALRAFPTHVLVSASFSLLLIVILYQLVWYSIEMATY